MPGMILEVRTPCSYHLVVSGWYQHHPKSRRLFWGSFFYFSEQAKRAPRAPRQTKIGKHVRSDKGREKKGMMLAVCLFSDSFFTD